MKTLDKWHCVMLFSASYEINSLVLSPCGGKAVTKEASISRGFFVSEGPKHQAYMAVSTQLSRPLTYKPPHNTQ